MTTSPNNFNQSIIEEFRSNGGKVGGPFEGGTLLLLNTVGAKSKQPRTIPLVYVPDGDRFLIAASKAGAPTNPDWYHNLVANPEVSVEVGQERFPARAIVADDAERDQLYNKIVAINPGFGEYQKKTTRKIPVVILERIA
jgi:deazaflavin-dependent oxidoreductase (nitroreductase family)